MRNLEIAVPISEGDVWVLPPEVKLTVGTVFGTEERETHHSENFVATDTRRQGTGFFKRFVPDMALFKMPAKGDQSSCGTDGRGLSPKTT